MRSLNKVTLIGNLGKDPHIQLLEGNIKIARCTLATSDSYKDPHGNQQTVTDWHSIVLWRSLADFAEKYLHTGSYVYLEGKIKTRSYDDKEGIKRYVTEIIADQVILLDKKNVENNDESNV